MALCTSSQVNLFRHLISKFSSRVPDFFVMLVLHYPPEMNIAYQSKYNVIYGDDWNFSYVDSLGVTTGNEDNLGGM